MDMSGRQKQESPHKCRL